MILYHATVLDNIQSILESGLIPGFNEPPGQDWLGKYSGKGIYFHNTFPDHELYQATMFDLDDSSDLLVVPIVFEVEIKCTEQEIRSKLALDEECPYTGDPLEIYNKHTVGVVWLDKISPECITQVYYPNDPRILTFITDEYEIGNTILAPHSL